MCGRVLNEELNFARSVKGLGISILCCGFFAAGLYRIEPLRSFISSCGDGSKHESGETCSALSRTMEGAEREDLEQKLKLRFLRSAIVRS